MKLFKITLLLTLFLFSCKNQTKSERIKFSESYLNTVLSDTRFSSFYLSIPICDQNKEKEFLIIENFDFKEFLKKTKKFTTNEYKIYVNRLFETNSCLKLSKSERLKFNFMIINQKKIDLYSKDMSDSIRTKFNENGVQISSIRDEFVNYIIHNRFENKCLIHTMSMTGRLVFKVW
jgi:hypothetical protein